MATFSIEEYQVEIHMLERQVDRLKEELQEKRQQVNDLTLQVEELKPLRQIGPSIMAELYKVPRYIRSIFGCNI